MTHPVTHDPNDFVDEDFDDVLRSTGISRARDHHYTFAHLFLRAAATERKLDLLAILASPQADDYLLDLWQSAYEFLAHEAGGKGQPPPGRVDATGLSSAEGALIDGYPTALVRLPPPQGLTEAYFVALCGVGAEIGTATRLWDTDAPLRFFMLELSLGGTMLCEWHDDTHSNFGGGPPADLVSFVAAVEQVMTPRLDV